MKTAIEHGDADDHRPQEDQEQMAGVELDLVEALLSTRAVHRPTPDAGDNPACHGRSEGVQTDTSHPTLA